MGALSDKTAYLVLVVDDSAPGRYLKSRLLRANGFRTVEAESGKQALDIVRDQKPDLLVLDVRLPDINGIDLCASLKAEPETSTILVLQTSALSISFSDRVRALDMGADAFLVEPAEPEELIASVRSLLRLRATERALEEARRRAEEANSAKSHFLASASHDLRQPLQAQRLFLTVLEQQLTTAEQRTTAGLVSDCLGASERLLKALMDLSAMDSGSVNLDQKVYALAPVIQRLAQEHRAEAEAKGLFIRARSCVAMGHTDAVMFERIMRNLISNAIRYTEKGGVLVSCRRRAGQLLVEVWDTGIGMLPSEQDLIFDEYYQVGNPERNSARGLGLGLSLVSKMAHLLGHTISVRSCPGRGSVFSVAVQAVDDESHSDWPSPSYPNKMSLPG